MVGGCRLKRGGPLIKRCRALYSGGDPLPKYLTTQTASRGGQAYVYPCMAVRRRLCVLRGAWRCHHKPITVTAHRDRRVVMVYCDGCTATRENGDTLGHGPTVQTPQRCGLGYASGSADLGYNRVPSTVRRDEYTDTSSTRSMSTSFERVPVLQRRKQAALSCSNSACTHVK